MNREKLVQQIQAKKSVLCVGLDSDIAKLPSHLTKDAKGVLAFNKAVIEATQSVAVSYKINTAFYESLGSEGWKTMEDTLRAIPKNIFTIADAKRGDIGNTSSQYAKAFFETMSFDAITLNPYLGIETCQPFLSYQDKWVILLGLTSNPSAENIQFMKTSQEEYFFEAILKESSRWGTAANTMYVVGATKDAYFHSIRQIIPKHFILVPGIGAQGGKIEPLKKLLLPNETGLLVNVSRDILFTDNSKHFQASIEKQAKQYHTELSTLFL